MCCLPHLLFSFIFFFLASQRTGNSSRRGGGEQKGREKAISDFVFSPPLSLFATVFFLFEKPQTCTQMYTGKPRYGGKKKDPKEKIKRPFSYFLDAPSFISSFFFRLFVPCYVLVALVACCEAFHADLHHFSRT